MRYRSQPIMACQNHSPKDKPSPGIPRNRSHAIFPCPPPETLKPIPIVLMHRTAARVIHKPILNALLVEAAEALQSRHGSPNLELFQADGTLGVVDAVFLGRAVDEHPRPSRGRSRACRRRRAEDDSCVGAFASGGAGFGRVGYWGGDKWLWCR